MIDMFIQVVSESGLFTPEDVAYVQNAGVSAVSSLKSSNVFWESIIKCWNMIVIFGHMNAVYIFGIRTIGIFCFPT